MMQRSRIRRSGGLTLLELMIAMTVMAMIVGALEALATGVQQSFEYNEGYGAATQNARVVLERIAKTVHEATASQKFPGVLVVAEKVGARRFPDVLVVWRPDGAAVDAAGLPRMNELVVYCPNLSSPNQFLEMSAPGDSRVAPLPSDTSAWASEIAAMRRSGATKKVVLTNLLRTCVSAGAAASTARGAVRFESRLRPSDAEWSQFQSGSLTWQAMSWVHGIFSAKTGMRQAWVRTEIQLMPGAAWSAQDAKGQLAATFFGSASVYYELSR